jgi:hypothetical protein
MDMFWVGVVVAVVVFGAVAWWMSGRSRAPRPWTISDRHAATDKGHTGKGFTGSMPQ